jgi:hypothetical protein
MNVKTPQIGGSDPDFPDYCNKMRLVFEHTENRFLVMKRKIRGDLKARRQLIRMKDIASKMTARNLHTVLPFLLTEVFPQNNLNDFFKFYQK